MAVSCLRWPPRQSFSVAAQGSKHFLLSRAFTVLPRDTQVSPAGEPQPLSVNGAWFGEHLAHGVQLTSSESICLHRDVRGGGGSSHPSPAAEPNS